MKETRSSYLLKAGRAVATILLLCSITACEKETTTLSPQPTVRVLIASSGLGDMSYNDNVLRGVLQAQQEHDFHVEYISPRNATEAENIFRSWKEEEEENKSRSYFTILAASEFEDLARSITTPAPVNNYLLFDTTADDLSIPVFHFAGYGVSFLAGVAAYVYTEDEKAAYIGGQQNEAFITECYDGFRDGYLYAGGKEVIETYLSPTQKGFSMPRRAYQLADSLYKLCPFIYAVAGNSNNGIYQYLRDYPNYKYTAGVDVDQSDCSSQIIGSMIKETNRCLKQYITSWIQGERLPMKERYTLESGFLSFKIAESYKPQLEATITKYLPIAIEKEKEYEKVNANSSRALGVRLQ